MPTTITPALLNAVRADLDIVLAQVAARHGLSSLNLGGITYNSSLGNFSAKMTGTAQGGVSVRDAKQERNYFQFRMYHPELPEVNTEVDLPMLGGKVIFVGKKSNSFGNEGRLVYTQVNNGKNYVVPAERVVAHFRALSNAQRVVSGAARV